jgi:predicted phosphodiesterase
MAKTKTKKPGGDAITEMARRLARLHPDAPARTLARRLVKEANGAITLHQARMRIQRQFGVQGKMHREQFKAVAPRAPRKAGDYSVPPSMATPWQPYVMNVVGTVGILSDVHVPYHSEIAVAAAIGHLKEQNLAGLLLNGDIADFYSISRYMKDPKQRDFKGELEAVKNFLAYLRQEFPDIPIVMKAGNHEERWTHWLWQHAAEISDDPRMSLVAWLDLEKHGVEWVEDQRPVMLGKLPVLHGHELPKGMAAPVNVARGAFLRTLSTVLVGHSHRTSNHAESDMWHKEIGCWSTGCLCDLHPDYARINKYNWGFAMVNVHKGGTFDVHNFRVMSNGTVRSA